MNAVASASAFLEIDDFSMNLDSTSTPLVTLGAEQPNYNLDMTITNATTGEAIVLNYIMAVGHSLTIDCVNKTVKYDNDLSALSALTANTNRSDWMTMLSGTNTITIEEDGMTNMAINITWEETSL
jgi:phage-related protein